jgi:hypothetical protein
MNSACSQWNTGNGLWKKQGRGKTNESGGRKKSCPLLELIMLHLPCRDKNETAAFFSLSRLNRWHHLQSVNRKSADRSKDHACPPAQQEMKQCARFLSRC